MTNHYEIVKMYHNGVDIIVDKYWLDKFKKGKTETLLHKIGDEFVIMAPPIRDYGHYILEEITAQLIERSRKMADRR